MRFGFSMLALAVLVGALACGDEPSSDSARASEPAQVAQADSAKAASAPENGHEGHSHAKRKERPLPNFSGWTLDDEKLEMSQLVGKRLLLFFFNPEVKAAPAAARAVGSVSELRGKYNFDIVGIATGSDRKTAKAFAKEHAIDYRVIDDSSAAIARRMGLRQPMGLLGIDAEGYVIFGVPAITNDSEEAETVLASQIRDALRLPALTTGVEPVLGSRPKAPNFVADIMDSDEKFDLSAHRGEAVILIFFLHTCPHCHQALAFLRDAIAELDESTRPTLVGVEVTGRTGAVRKALKDNDLDFFPVVFDSGTMRDDYGVFGGVPDIFFIDTEGRIAARVRGWRPEIDEPLARMRMAKLAGTPVPMLLSAKGYSGSEACRVCHEPEHETWLFTQHASAFDTLVKHGESKNDECIGCHVVGYGKPGGFVDSVETKSLEDVGCESCHGRGGPHLSPEFAGQTDYTKTCETCHTPKHSLFDYATFLPKVSHAANARVLSLSLEERQQLLAKLGSAPREVLPQNANYVGSEACTSCHESEHDTWLASGHARAVETLADKGQDANADCLACHTTAFGKPGGFAKDVAAASQPDLARVGCESCHGPGGEHVAEGSTKIDSIVSLGDKCDSCVIMQICGSCHDDANDPGFEFEVLDKIEAQRHGTIEPGTGKPKTQTAAQATQKRLASVLDVDRAVGVAFEHLHGK